MSGKKPLSRVATARFSRTPLGAAQPVGRGAASAEPLLSLLGVSSRAQRSRGTCSLFASPRSADEEYAPPVDAQRPDVCHSCTLHLLAPEAHPRYMFRRQLALMACFLICLPALLAQSAVVGNSFLEVHAPFSPLIARVDGDPHLVYELHITNFKSAAVTLTRVSVLQGNTPLHVYEASDLASSLAKVGARAEASDSRRLEGGERVVFYVWLPLPDRASPSAIRHRIWFRLDNGTEESVDASEVLVSRSSPAVLGPPLRGGPWVAVYDPWFEEWSSPRRVRYRRRGSHPGAVCNRLDENRPRWPLSA